MQYCESDFFLYIVYIDARFQLIIIQHEQIFQCFMNDRHRYLVVILESGFSFC